MSGENFYPGLMSMEVYNESIQSRNTMNADGYK